MSELLQPDNIMSNRLVQIAAVGVSALTIAGCTNHSGSSKAQEAVARQTPAATSTLNTLSHQYDTGYDFINNFSDPYLEAGSVSIPSTITNPYVRTITIKAVNSKVANDVIARGEEFGPDSNAMQTVQILENPDIKAKAVDGLAQVIYAGALFELGDSINGLDAHVAGHIAADESFLRQLLTADPAKYSDYQARIDAYKAVSARAQAELRGPVSEYNNYVEDQATLSSAWHDAQAVTTKNQADFRTAATQATMELFDHSPKAQADDKYNDYSEEKNLHHCDNKPTPAKDTCAADEIVYNSPVGFDGSYDVWAPLVKNPAQKLRIEAAAADQAIGWLGADSRGEAELWSSKVHNAKDRARIDQADVSAAEHDYDLGYRQLGDGYANDISNLQLKDATLKYNK